MLATEMFKVYQHISPSFFSEVFHRRDIDYNLRSNSEFVVPNVKAIYPGSGGIS